MATFGGWMYRADPDATVAAYNVAERGGVESCQCAGCRNFLSVRDSVFPAPFLDFLKQLGIDPHKDGEIYHTARVSAGRHIYGGWFHFVGTLERTGDFSPVFFGERFSAWMCNPSAPSLSSLSNLSLVQLEIYADDVPWLLPEPEW
jgi:hypothetical protein